MKWKFIISALNRNTSETPPPTGNFRTNVLCIWNNHFLVFSYSIQIKFWEGIVSYSPSSANQLSPVLSKLLDYTITDVNTSPSPPETPADCSTTSPAGYNPPSSPQQPTASSADIQQILDTVNRNKRSVSLYNSILHDTAFQNFFVVNYKLLFEYRLTRFSLYNKVRFKYFKTYEICKFSLLDQTFGSYSKRN